MKFGTVPNELQLRLRVHFWCIFSVALPILWASLQNIGLFKILVWNFVEHWKATLENDPCVMNDPFFIQDESKLSLQVFTTPFTAETKKRPVMVFIHGGAWQFGSAEMISGQG